VLKYGTYSTLTGIKNGTFSGKTLTCFNFIIKRAYHRKATVRHITKLLTVNNIQQVSIVF